MNASQKGWDIQMQGLTAGYGERRIIDGMDAHLPAGKISVILGESGCGKTTLLRVLLGLMPASGGKLFIGGADLFSLSPHKFRSLRRRFGVLFQDGALLGALNLEENVALPLREHTRLPESTIQKTVMNTLDLVGLAHAAKLYPGELSGGMRKRAGLARAIIIEPPLLFCDEPTSGLDPLTSAKMNRLLLDMNQQYADMTTVVITHDMQSVRSIADHALMLRGGKAVFDGSCEELFSSQDSYLHEFVNQKSSDTPQMLTPAVDTDVRSALDAWING